MRILGITLPENKRIEIALTELYGVGRSRALSILAQAKVDVAKKAKDISPDEENAIRKIIEGVKIEEKTLLLRVKDFIHKYRLECEKSITITPLCKSCVISDKAVINNLDIERETFDTELSKLLVFDCFFEERNKFIICDETHLCWQGNSR